VMKTVERVRGKGVCSNASRWNSIKCVDQNTSDEERQ
jgi:hypothetical protein